MSQRTYGILLRVYTPKAEEVEGRVNRALQHVQQIQSVRDAFPALRRLILLVPRVYDCGQTSQALIDRVASEGHSDWADVFSPSGYHSCEVLNEGLKVLSVDTSHALIISGKAMSYLTRPALLVMDQAFERCAKVAGLAVDELRDMVLSGRIQNTFAGWDIEALLHQYAFDNRTDVEEIAPLIRLARKFGKCIAPIDVKCSVLDVAATETARMRHSDVMTKKTARQLDECKRLNSSFEFIQSSVM